ncbi:low molecular weight protein-tyrosine-phosphatase [Bombiscardovia coagulans]|uniref:protein-tyrosine-phosphatase n=1 Tax=Bombiscardovia coagulans TaxID=686666 RepID=A0A261ETP4_9BIFI|nr:low molecular weight protein-tyrosine-phosphatase [Bombiscardovia coagulans]OZG50228.1 phosphotyrosine protein phosphatase [Bombiscardovia coagulans]
MALTGEQKPFVVMTVCTGNICRSPMAEVILRKCFADRGIDESQVRVESSGVSDEEFGNPIDRRAQKVLKERGYEVPQDHFAHRISREEAQGSDLLLPMTADHMRSLLRILPADKHSAVHLYRSFDPSLPKTQPGHESDIDLADPWYGGPEEFEVAIDQVEHTAPYIVDWVLQKL